MNPHNPECKSITSAAIEKAYDLGRTHAADPLEGYTNLTQAIADGVKIDYEKLDGRRIALFNEKSKDLVFTSLMRDEDHEAESPYGWNTYNIVTLQRAWDGVRGWTLYIKGEIPVKRKTADQLEPGTYFKGTHPKSLVPYLVAMKGGGGKVHLLPDMRLSNMTAPGWEVIEVLGKFEIDE